MTMKRDRDVSCVEMSPRNWIEVAYLYWARLWVPNSMSGGVRFSTPAQVFLFM